MVSLSEPAGGGRVVLEETLGVTVHLWLLLNHFQRSKRVTLNTLTYELYFLCNLYFKYSSFGPRTILLLSCQRNSRLTS